MRNSLFLVVLFSSLLFSVSATADVERITVTYRSCDQCTQDPCQESYVLNKIVNEEVVAYRRIYRYCDDNTGRWHDTGWSGSVIPGGPSSLPSYFDSMNNFVITVFSGSGGDFT